MKHGPIGKRVVPLLCVLGHEFASTPARPEALYLSGPGAVVRVNLDGSNVTLLAPGGPEWTYTDVAVDSKVATMYTVLAWLQTGQACVSSQENNHILCDFGVFSLTVDEAGQRIYVGKLNGGIQGCDFDGGHRTTLTSGFAAVYAINVDSGRQKLYWSEFYNEGRIVRADIINGSLLANQETVVRGLGRVWEISLDTEGGKVYWVNYFDTRSQVQRANLDGSDVETLATDTRASSVAFARVRNKIYWVDDSQPGATIVVRANPDGSSQEEAFRLSGEFPWVDAGPEPVSIETTSWGRIKQIYRK